MSAFSDGLGVWCWYRDVRKKIPSTWTCDKNKFEVIFYAMNGAARILDEKKLFYWFARTPHQRLIVRRNEIFAVMIIHSESKITCNIIMLSVIECSRGYDEAIYIHSKSHPNAMNEKVNFNPVSLSLFAVLLQLREKIYSTDTISVIELTQMRVKQRSYSNHDYGIGLSELRFKLATRWPHARPTM